MENKQWDLQTYDKPMMNAYLFTLTSSQRLVACLWVLAVSLQILNTLKVFSFDSKVGSVCVESWAVVWWELSRGVVFLVEGELHLVWAESVKVSVEGELHLVWAESVKVSVEGELHLVWAESVKVWGSLLRGLWRCEVRWELGKGSHNYIP